MRRRFTIHKGFIDYNKEPLTFKITSGGSINWTASDSSLTKTIEYKLNDSHNWASITSNTEESAPTITVKAGDKIQFRGDNTAYCGDNPDLYSTFGGSTAEFEIEGNIMSLINSTDFSTLTTLESNFTFAFLFSNCTGLTSAENLILPATSLTMGCYLVMFVGCKSLTTAPKLPATTLAMGCYVSMFQGCTSLTSAPELPVTTLASNCYSSMFYSCTSLTTAPELPARTLANYCYNGMFYGCSSLTTAPELPATTLVEYCYDNMFNGCTKLNYIKCLATDISASNCTNNWVSGVAATGTFVQNPDMDEWKTGVNGIPVNWTVEGGYDFSTKPLTFNILSAGTINWTATNTTVTKTIEYKLNNGEWTSIISNTGSSAPTINVIEGDKVQFRGSNTQYATSESNYNSFSGSTALFKAKGNIMSLIYGDDFKNKLTISSTYTFYGLFSDCTGLTSANNLILPATSLTNYCYGSMFLGCTSLTSAPKLPTTTLANDCYYQMFLSCTSLTTATELPATTLANDCYKYMFLGCTSLTTAPELPATTLASYCYIDMFDGCKKLNYIKCLATNISANNCTKNWVVGVASGGTFVKAADMTGWTTGNSGIPSGWTVRDA